jgi:hypothetical protein
MILCVFVIMASVSRHKESIRTMKIHLNADRVMKSVEVNFGQICFLFMMV